MDTLLNIKNLKTSFFTYAGEVKAVRGIDFKVNKGEAIGIVGESGCGKSVTMLSILKRLSDTGKVVGGSALFEGKDLIKMSKSDILRIRGNEIGMIFQNPMTSLNPVYTIGNQMIEPLLKHKNMTVSEAKNTSIKLLGMVGIPEPEKRLKQYPHEFSGGMRQRVMIAMALSCSPKLLIADEPTTALDVTIQAQILDLMKDLKSKLSTSIILITHDLGVVATLCSRIIVMYGGLIVEEGTKRDLFYNTSHPYTLGLLGSLPNPKKLQKERLIPINGQPPDLLSPPNGCAFRPRCRYAMNICSEIPPPLYEISEDHKSACHLLDPRCKTKLKGGM
jgi:oligopeptide transport system ATP-binding protein